MAVWYRASTEDGWCVLKYHRTENKNYDGRLVRFYPVFEVSVLDLCDCYALNVPL